MAVHSVLENIDATGHFGFAFGTAVPVVHEYTRTWQVVTDRLDGSIQASTAIPVVLRQPYKIFALDGVTVLEFDNFSFVDSIDTQRVEFVSDGQALWKVSAHYGTINLDYNEINPLVNKPLKRWQFAQYEEDVDVDINGEPVLNTAFQPYDPTVKRDKTRPVLIVERNEATFSPSLAFSYVDTVNSATWAGAAKHCVKVADISDEEQWSPIIGKYHKVTYEFHFNKDTWKKKLISAGYNSWNGTDWEQIVFDDGSTPSAPVPLDADGFPLGNPIDATTIVVTEYDIYNETDFSSAFNMDNLFT